MNARACAALAAAFFTCNLLAAATFHVAPAGNDQNAGTQRKPFATLQRAQRAVRELKHSGKLAGPVTVSLHGGTWSEWQARGKDVHSLYADPLLVDPEHGDFRLQPESPVWGLGFQPIDLSQVGPRTPTGPISASRRR